MIYYATIDTNVIVSSFYSSTSIPAQIIDKVFSRQIIPLLNNAILDEYRDVLMRNKFNFDNDKIELLLNMFLENGIFLEQTKTNEYFKDEDDIVFYEITLTDRSTGDAYLVTGNKKHFPQKRFVVSPREMLEIMHNDI